MAEIGEIIRAVISYGLATGSTAQNVFYWEVQGDSDTDANLLQFLTDWAEDDWGVLWDNNAENSADMFLIEVDVLNGDGTVKRNIGENSISVVGLDTAGQTAAGVAGYIQATTERAKSLGKKYVPGYGEGSVTDGAFISSVLTNLAAMLVLWLLDIPMTGAAVLAPGVLSRVTDTFQEFTGGGYVTDVPAYQRRRKPGVGS